jgi:predicted Zn-dependent protease
MNKLSCLTAALLTAFFTCLPLAAQERREGVDVGEPSAVRNLVPARDLERSAAKQYAQMLNEARAKGALAPDSHPQLIRLRQIANDLLPHVARFNPEARKWRWEVNLIGSKQLNAFCMPGGKIAFYTGIIDTLRLNDDEIAMIMGHEIAHALREHARERIAKTQLTQIGAALLGEFIGGGQYSGAFRLGGDLMTLKFSRDDETEADIVGMELAARAGYDPRAGITLWQKMGQASRGAPPAWLSTHPAGDGRIAEIERHLPAVMPIYEANRRRPSDQ